MDRPDVSVIIPTIGRPELLRRVLESLEECDPQPAEVVVVDQSADASAEPLAAEIEGLDVRVVRSDGLGRGLAVNEGIEAAAHDVVLIVDDDCTVRRDWVRRGSDAMAERPDGLISGQVLPAAPDPRLVPSSLVEERPIDYSGSPYTGVLYAGNMGCSRRALLAAGGFDPRILPAAEDCDLAYRWLRAGGSLRHVPELVVWHHDWRRPDELERHYAGYYEGLGRFYAKHLRAGDLRVLRFVARDLLIGARAFIRREPKWADPHRGVFAGLGPGLRAGWREFSRSRRDPP